MKMLKNNDSRKRNNGNDSSPEVEKLVSYIENGGSNLYEILRENGPACNIGKERRTSSSQMRKFYDNVVNIEEKYTGRQKALAQLSIITPLAYYANKRKLLDINDYNFLSRSVDALVKSTDSDFELKLKRFRDVFQGIIAYGKE